MAWYIALLRGVNVGGRGKVSMAELARCLEGLGFQKVNTLLNSGNVVFTAPDQPTSKLEQVLETETAAKLGLRSDFMVRTTSEMEEVIAANPFPAFAAEDPSHYLVMFLKAQPAPAAIQALKASIPGREELEVVGRHAYVCYPEGIGRSKLTIEPKLKVSGTGRNWNTVQKLAALARD
ncbi:MAG TPA: DUF1697 domain-containing protein [Chloroflexota bacterium]|nr:DUF1697 domain-containing protein [Chloroflexota bacterium]